MDAQRRWIVALFASLGAYALLAQVALFRESFLLFSGNELSAAVQLALWLGFTGLGGGLGARLPGRAAPWLLAALPVCGLWMIAAVRALPVFAGGVGQEPGIFRSVLFLVLAQLPLNVVAGMLFPAGLRWARERGVEIATGTAYLAEAVGAAVAGVAFTFLLSGWAPGVTVMAVASGLLALLAAALAPASATHADSPPLSSVVRRPSSLFPGHRALPLASGAVGLLALGLGLSGVAASSLDDLWWTRRQGGAVRVLTVETPYQRLDVERRQGQHTLYSNGVPVAVFEDLDEACSGYRMADLYMALHGSPDRMLVIGNGDPTLIRRVLEQRMARLTYLPSDPGVLPALRRAQLPGIPPDDAGGLNLLSEDGRPFLHETADSFDLIILDLPLPLTAAENRFFTVEAFRDMKKRLRPGGVVAFQLAVPTHYVAGESEELVASIRRALAEAFGRVDLLAGDSLVLVAGAGEGSLQLDEVARRFSTLPAAVHVGRRDVVDEIGKRAYFAAIFGPWFDDFRRERQAVELAAVATPANRDRRPVAYYLALKRWAHEAGIGLRGGADSAGGDGGGTFRAVGFVALPWAVAAALVLGAHIFPGRNRSPWVARTRRGVLASAMLASGWAGMMGEIVLIFMYQSRYGLMYRDMGALYATYMAGLALGGALAQRHLTALAAGTRALCAVRLALIAVAAAALVGLASGNAAATYAMLFLYALVLGVEYPILNELYLRQQGGDHGAGVLHGMDHLGAALAAAAGATLALPLAGSAVALGAVIVVNALIFAVWLALGDLK